MSAPTPGATTRTVLVAGSSGLVGSEIVRQLAGDPGVSRITMVIRRPAGISAPKAVPRIVDFEHLDADPAIFAVDQIFCALGTTIRAAGSQAAFRKVDFDYPLALARIGLAQGARHFLLVSALGADATSRIFYSRVKGELEDALRSLGYRSITIARPSLLLGKRDEFRLGERIGALVGHLIPGRYRPVEGELVAKALVDSARVDAPGLRIIESEEIRGEPTGVDP